MSKALATAAVRPALSRYERLTRVYQSEIYPLFDHWFTDPLIEGLEANPVTNQRVLDAACGAGDLSAALRQQNPTLLVGLDPGGAMLNLAMEHESLQGGISFGRAGSPGNGLPFIDGVFDHVFSHDRADGAVDPWANLGELVRVCKRGGRVALSTSLSGTWAEPLDLLQEALERRGEKAACAALAQYQSRFPTPEQLSLQLAASGLTELKVSIQSKQILFRSGREFFFSALIELGPLRLWKSLVGKGEPLQAAFASVKDSIDTYYAGRSFTVTANVATVTSLRQS
jgi:ubiquinone/menaquinone biosynthesis C-methylase UbiE